MPLLNENTNNNFVIQDTTPEWAKDGGNKLSNLSEKKSQKLNNLANKSWSATEELSRMTPENRTIAVNRLEHEADADSGQYWRGEGYDALERAHNVPLSYDIDTGAGFDLKRATANPRKKVYEQYAHANNVPLEEAVKQVDREYEAYKVDPTLPSQIAKYREQGNIDEDFGLTSFDTYRGGDLGYNWAKDVDAKANPKDSLLNQGDFTTEGKEGYFGRLLAEGSEYGNRLVAQGLAVPGAKDPEVYEAQMEVYNRAKAEGRGAFAEKGSAMAMEAALETSYNQKRDRESRLTKARLDRLEEQRGELGYRLANTLGAAGSTFVKPFMGLADTVVEQFGGDLGTDEELTEAAQDLFNYDAEIMNRVNNKAKAKIEKMNKDGWTVSGFVDVVEDFGTQPELLGEVVGFMGSMAVGGPTGAVGKAVKLKKSADAALKSGKITKEAHGEIVQASKQALKEAGTLKRGLAFASKNLGFTANTVSMSSADIDAYAKEAGIEVEDVSMEKKLGIGAMNALLNKTDFIVDKGLLVNPTMRSAMVDIIGGATQKQVKELGKGLAKVGFIGTVGAGVEGGTEYAQQLITQVNQQVGEETGKTLLDAWNDEANALDRQVSGVAGVAGAQQIAGTGAVGTTVERTGRIAKEKLDDRFQVEATGKETKEPETVEGRRTMWESVDADDFEIDDNPDTKAAYNRSLAGYVTDVLFKEGESEEAGYEAGNTLKVFDDAADKIIKINKLDNDDATKAVVRAGVVREAYNQLSRYDKKAKRTLGTEEEINSFLKDTLERFKGDKEVEAEVQSIYKEKLEDTFKDIKAELDPKDAQVLDKVPLTEENYRKVKDVITSMRTLGSEGLTSFADRIESALDSHQEVLGSEQELDKDGNPLPPKRKNADQVRKEILITGFMSGDSLKKSIEQHRIDLMANLGKVTGDKEKADRALEEIESFIESRTPDKKVDLFRKDIVNGLPKVSLYNIKQIRSQIDILLNDNRGIYKLLKEVSKKPTLTKDEKAKVNALLKSLVETGKTLKEMEALGNEGKHKALFERVKAKYDKPEKLPETVIKYGNTLADRQDDAVQPEDEMSEGTDISTEEMTSLFEDTQEEVPTSKEATETPEVETKTETTSVQEESEEVVNNAYTKVKELSKKIDSAKRLQELVTKKDKAEIARLLKEYRSMSRDFKEIMNEADAEIEKLMEEKAQLSNEIGKFNNEIKDINDKIDAVNDAINSANKSTNPDKVGGLVQSIAKMFRAATGKAIRTLQSLKSALYDLKNKKFEQRDDKLLEKQVVADEIDMQIKGKEGLKKDLASKRAEIKEAQQKVKDKNQVAKTRIAKLKEEQQKLINSSRTKLEEAGNGTVKANKKLTGSTSEIITNSKTMSELVDTLVDNAAAVIKKSKKGKSKVKRALTTFKEFTAKRKNKIPVQKYLDTTNNVLALPRELLDQYEEVSRVSDMINSKDPEVRKLVERAFAVASLRTYYNLQSMRSYNDSQLETAVHGIFGNLTGGTLRSGYVEQAKAMIRSGEILPISSGTGTGGRALLQELGVSLDNMSEKDALDVQTALHSLVMNHMIRASSNEKGAQRKVVTLQDGNMIIREPQAGATGKSVNVIDFRDMEESMLKAWDEAGSVFEFVTMKEEAGISFEPVKVQEGKKTRRTNVENSKETTRYLNEQGARKWKFNSDFESLIEAYKNEDGTIDRQKFIESVLGGTKAQVVGKVQVMSAKSTAAKYDADVLDLERMLDTLELVEDKDFYLGWDYTSSNRSMIDNPILNPQNSKFSRFMVSMDDMTNTIELKNEKDVHMANLAIAQALDIGDVDKQTDTKVLEDLATKFTITKDGVKFHDKEFEEMVNKGTIEAIRVWDSGIGTGEILHAYQAIRTLKELNESGKVNTSLALEIDGITNGMMAVLMQMGYTSESMKHLQRGGLYLEGSEFKTHGEYKDANGADTYQAPIEEIQSNMSDTQIQAIDKILGGKWRNFMKGSVMVFIYGAGIANIRENAARALVVGNSYIKGAMATGNLEALKELAGEEAVNKITVKNRTYNVKTGNYEESFPDPSDKGTVFLEEADIQILTEAIDENIGKAIQEGFNETFKGVSEFRKALKNVELLNYLVFRSEMNKKLQSRGVSRITDLPTQEIQNVYQELLKEGTYYSGTNALGGQQDYVKMETTKGAGTISVTVPPAGYLGGAGSNSEVTESLKDLIANIGAVGVVNVHSVDGATMITGHTEAVLNIFDALVMGTNFESNKKSSENINKAFFDLNAKHSMLGKATKKVLGNLDKIDWSLLETDDKLAEALIADVVRVSGKEQLDIDNFAKTIETLEDVHEGRKDMARRDMITNQYYISEELPGYEGKADEVELVFNEETMDKDLAKMQSAFGNLERKLFQAKAKQDRLKKINGIITDIELAISDSGASTQVKTRATKILNKLIEAKKHEEC